MIKLLCRTWFRAFLATWLTVATGVVNGAQVWFEDFEAPVVSNKFVGTDPVGWNPGGSSQGLSNTNCNEFTTTNGAQAAWVYGSNSMTTKSTNLTETLDSNSVYTLTFDVCKLSSLPDADYVVHLKAGSTILATATGTVSTTDMSEKGTLEYTTGTAHPNMGENLYITLTAINNTHPHYDSMALDVSDAPADTTKPTPDPMQWQVLPFAVDYDSISMTCTTATDEATVQYLFTNTVKGTSSGWQFNREWCETNLTAETLYSYKVKARDTSANLNETDWSTPVVSAVTLDAEPTLIFKDSFETPDVTGDTSTDPTGWTPTGHGGYQGLRDEASGLVSTIYGAQVAKLYSDSTLTTAATYLTNTLTGETTYFLSFNVGIPASPGSSGYTVQLLADTNILGIATGTVTTAEMSLTSDSILYEAAADDPYIGNILAIRLVGSPQTPAYDNVRLYAEPFPPAGTILMVR